jgi:lipid-A-disaccharide synthase
MAKWAKQNNYKTVFYISPQIWAWKESRVKAIKKYVDKLLVILPFDQQFYKKWTLEVEYVGHPLVPVVETYIKEHSGIQPDIHTIALLPGSRKQEIKTKLPIMLEATKNFKDYHFIIAKAPSIENQFYEGFIKDHDNVKMETDNTYSILMQSSAALVTSGTATLETALFNVPEIVCYKAGSISYEIGRRLIKLKFICLVNLIMNKEVVKELIQHNLTPEKITIELKSILFDEQKREKIKQDYCQLKKMLSEGGNASFNAAKSIYDFVNK